MISISVGFFTSLAVMSLTGECGMMPWRRASLLMSTPSGQVIFILTQLNPY